MKKLLYLLIAVTMFLTLMPTDKAEASTGKDVVTIANKYKGVPYLWGGTTTKGFDCSGFTSFVFKQVGVTLPRTAASQYGVGTAVSKSNLQPGDLVFFSSSSSSGITHVGIYSGDNNFISSTSSKGVAVVSMDNTYWKPKYTGAKRVLSNASTNGIYSDLASSHFAYTAVKTLSSKNVISGYEDGTFRPGNSVTRGQAAAIVNRVLKHTPKSSASFKDVPSSNRFAKDIAAMKELKIINGYSNGNFGPNDTLTRAQMAIIVQRAFDLKNTTISSSAATKLYTDVNSSHYAYSAIIALNANDKTTGFKTKTFRHADVATRADFSAAVYNGTLAQ